MKHIESLEEFKSVVLDSTVPVLVDFYAEWCAPCKAMSPVFEATAAEFGDTVRCVKVDVDTAPAIAGEYGVMSIPTFIAFVNGEPKATHNGRCSADELKALVA